MWLRCDATLVCNNGCTNQRPTLPTGRIGAVQIAPSCRRRCGVNGLCRARYDTTCSVLALFGIICATTFGGNGCSPT